MGGGLVGWMLLVDGWMDGWSLDGRDLIAFCPTVAPLTKHPPPLSPAPQRKTVEKEMSDLANQFGGPAAFKAQAERIREMVKVTARDCTLMDAAAQAVGADLVVAITRSDPEVRSR